MIASVARESGRCVEVVGGESYALTLWAYLHGKDAQRIEALTREYEDINLAEMVVRGWLGGTPEIDTFRRQWRSKLGPVKRTPESIEEMMQRADEMWTQHHARKPVS